MLFYEIEKNKNIININYVEFEYELKISFITLWEYDGAFLKRNSVTFHL